MRNRKDFMEERRDGMRERIWTKDFIFVCLSNFFVSLNFYILATAFPLYVKDILNGNETTDGISDYHLFYRDCTD